MSLFSNPAVAITEWAKDDGFSYLASCVFHMVLFLTLALVLGTIKNKDKGDAPSFETPPAETPPPAQADLTNFDLKDASIDPSELTTDSLTMTEAPHVEGDPNGVDNVGDSAPTANEGGGTPAGTSLTMIGMGGYDVKGVGLGPVYHATGGGVGVGKGTGKNPGAGGSGFGFGSRGMKKGMLGSGGGTKQTERAVAAALAWLARHQNQDGSWFIDYHARCRGPGCTGPGSSDAPGAATAFGLLPFLAAGQTHETKGPYRDNIYRGITWMISHQKPTGDLSVTGGQTQMYSHGLATIMLCEAYGMSHDKRLEAPAKAALHFIEACQDQQTGGWWYTFKQPGGDTSVFGWQFMALKSGKMAGLLTSSMDNCFELGKKWLDSVGKGASKGLFSYQPPRESSDTMTAVGLLCTQYLGAHYSDPRILEGTKFLMANMPNAANGKVYYWYYATQVMHNQPGPDWDKWNRQMRTVLIKSQCGDAGCANGSWDPMKGMPEWAAQGGRLMMTSLAALTLEVYYRYLPLYKEMGGGGNVLADLDVLTAASPDKAAAAKPAEKKPAEKPAEKK
jgi:hypothetical protein